MRIGVRILADLDPGVGSTEVPATGRDLVVDQREGVAECSHW